MKKINLLLAFVCLASGVFAQVKVISGGNVGVNATNPLSIFQIYDSYFKTAFGSANTSGLGWGTGYMGFNAVRQSNGDWLSLNDNSTSNGGNVIYGCLDGAINFVPISSTGNSPQSNSDANILDKIAMTIGGNGNVGIGITSPNNILQVKDLINFNNTLYSTFLGYYTGTSSTGAYNTATGYSALYSNTTGNYNTAYGYLAGYTNTTASYNTFTGASSGYSNTTGQYNTFSGFESGKANTTAGYNTFSGYQSGKANTTGAQNAFFGFAAGVTNTTGAKNTFIGYAAGDQSTTSSYNTFVGSYAGYANTTGAGNTFSGYQTGIANTTGHDNTFYGSYAGQGNTIGLGNTAIGESSGSSNTNGDYNTYIGYYAHADAGTYDNVTSLGYEADAKGSNYVRIGNSSVATSWVQVDWTIGSDARIKNNINQNVPGLDFIKLLKPVTYHLDIHEQNSLMGYPEKKDSSGNVIGIDTTYWEGKYDIEKIQFSGFLAQQVDSAAQAIGYDFSGVYRPKDQNDLYGLRYSQFVVPLVKAVQEQNMTVDSLKSQLKTTDSLLKVMQIMLSETSSGLQQQIDNCCTVNQDKSLVPTNNNFVDSKTGDAKLFQNVPNPFNTKTNISYYLPEGSSNGSLLIFDMQGTLLKTFKGLASGDGNVVVNSYELKPGMYMYSLISNGKEVDTKKMILTE